MTPQEINKQVARKLGWVECDLTFKSGLNEPTFYKGLRNPKTQSISVPDYCTSIATAWEIVDNTGKDWFIMRQIGNAWDASFYHDGKWINEWADTAPMAICLAYLKLENQ